MRRTLTGLAVIAMAATVIAAGPGDDPAATTIDALDVGVDGTTISLDGTVNYGGQAPVVLGTDPIGDTVAPDTGQYGLDLTGLSAYVADGDEGVVTLVWQATQLDNLPPPEFVRYYWTVLTQAKGQPFPSGEWAFQAKTTDIVSAGNLGDQSPEQISSNILDYANSTIPSFRVRGNCATDVVSNCGHVAWVTGEFDFDNDQIRFYLPLDLENAALLRAGNSLTPDPDGAWVSIQAAADNANTRDSVVQDTAYLIPERAATATLYDADGNEVSSAALDVSDGDGVSGIAGAISAPAPGDYTLVVQACFAGNCDSSVSAITAS